MPRITISDKKRRLNSKRYNEHSKHLAYELADGSEDEKELVQQEASVDHETFKKLHPVQISPKDVDMIVSTITRKADWRGKLDNLQEKWKGECLQKNISEASVDVAFEILRDIHRQGSGSKECCGCCGAKPQSEREERQASMSRDKPYVPRGLKDDISDDEEEEDYFDFERYSRTTRFCDCPCPHCSTVLPKYRGGSVTDNLIPIDLKQRLKLEIEKLENVPEEKKDWHPGTNKQVLDLIHPSLYCFVEKVSVSEKQMEPEVAKEREWYFEEPAFEKPTSNRCQWLPAEFEVTYPEKTNAEGGDESPEPTVKINSYINNIDPIKQPELYDVIGKIFGKFHKQMKASHISIGHYNNLQVIVKAANIVVTPEKPFYAGGTFHKEGMPYEHIATTGIYYYHSENVKNSYLEFRSSIAEPYGYQQDDVKGCFEQYGLHEGDLQFRSEGAILTKEDRCVIFQNNDQHRVRHFFPIDPSKPAIRKILVFFIVHPRNRIISTQDVDVQRFDFLINRCFILNKLVPFPIVHEIVKYLPHFTHEEALKYREDLMNQRKYFVDEQNLEVEREFSLCEH